MTKLADWDAPLQTLWQRRDDLDEHEWEQLYHLVQRILLAYPFKEHTGLMTPLEDCIADFIAWKVFKPGAEVNTPIHANALRCYFQRFLIDLQRANPAKQRAPLDEETTEKELATLSWRQFLETDSDTTALEEPLVRERFQTAAREFLEQQEPWVGLYLRHHFCARYCGKEPVPLVRFKKQLPSYHHKAQRLGLAPPSDGDYRRTLLVRWLCSLGLALDPNDRDAVQVALKILCEQTLLLVKDILPFDDATDSAHSEKD